MRVLIVEDEAVLALSYKMALDGGGCEVIGIAASARSAIAMTEQQHPDIVLMDIRLQGQMDGIEAAEVITKSFNTPIIYMTGNTDSETRERALLTNPRAYLEKPIDCEKLHAYLCVGESLPD